MAMPGWSVSRRGGVIRFGHVLQPICDLSVLRFLQGNMHHPCGCGRAVPVFLSRWDPHRVASADHARSLAAQANQPDAIRNIERLAQRVGVPCCPCAGFEGHAQPAHR